MGEPTVILPGAGEIIGDSPDRRVEVLSDADPLHATWSRFAAGRDGAGLHIHHHHTDLFYVLDGELTVRLGGEDRQVPVPAGSLAAVPPLVIHGFRNSSDADVRYLNLHAPGCGFIGYMRGIRDGTGEDFDQDEPPADGGRPPSDASIGAAELEEDAGDRRVEVLIDIEELSVRRVLLDGGAIAAGAGGWVFVVEGELGLGADGPRCAPGTWASLPRGSTDLVAGADGALYLALQA